MNPPAPNSHGISQNLFPTGELQVRFFLTLAHMNDLSRPCRVKLIQGGGEGEFLYLLRGLPPLLLLDTDGQVRVWAEECHNHVFN